MEQDWVLSAIRSLSGLSREVSSDFYSEKKNLMLRFMSLYSCLTLKIKYK